VILIANKKRVIKNIPEGYFYSHIPEGISYTLEDGHVGQNM
jgi:hypothetical protein